MGKVKRVVIGFERRAKVRRASRRLHQRAAGSGNFLAFRRYGPRTSCPSTNSLKGDRAGGRGSTGNPKATALIFPRSGNFLPDIDDRAETHRGPAEAARGGKPKSMCRRRKISNVTRACTGRIPWDMFTIHAGAKSTLVHGH